MHRELRTLGLQLHIKCGNGLCGIHRDPVELKLKATETTRSGGGGGTSRKLDYDYRAVMSSHRVIKLLKYRHSGEASLCRSSIHLLFYSAEFTSVLLRHFTKHFRFCKPP